MRTLHRRGLRLASALVAAGLALSAAPSAALADDDSGLLVLTDSQAEELSERAQLDPYGDGAAVDPQHAQDRQDTVPTPAAGGGSSLDESGTSASGWKLTTRSAVESYQGMAVTAPVTGAGKDYFALHALGSVQRRTTDGTQVWSRNTESLYADWQVSPLRPYQVEPYPARIVMGFNAVSPFTMASDNGYTTGDLTGDGVDDVVFTATVGVSPYRPFSSPGSSLPNGTFVTVLDGKTGRTLWHKLYAGAFNVKLVGKTLVVADSPYYNLNSPKDSRATLNGIRFSYAKGALTPASTWSYDAGSYTGVAWGSLEPLGNGLVAASWNQRKLSADAAPSGHTLVLDTADGSVTWSRTDRLYSRQLHLDASRGRLVALEQSDPNEGIQYEIASYALGDGTRTPLDTRVNALPLTMEVGDIRGSSKPEYTVSESTLDSNLFINANTVRALDGTDGGELWSRTVKRDPANGHDGGGAWGLKALDGTVVASYKDDAGYDTAQNRGASRAARLAVLSGKDGTVRWEKRGITASQMWTQPFTERGSTRLRTVDTNQNVRAYTLRDGKQEDLLPLPGPVWSAVSTDVNKDRKQDLIVGGQSNAVFAYDGPSLVSGAPKRLWSATVPGQVHAIVKADTDGDGRDELVVAADSAAVVLDSRTGRVLTTIDGKGRFVRTVTASDVDGDRRAEVIVATDTVRVHRGNGKLLWEYTAPASAGDVVFSDVSAGDGRVYAQYATAGSLGRSEVTAAGVALRGKDGRTAWSFAPKPGEGTDGSVLGAPLRGGTFAAPGIPYADGHAVVYTFFTKGTALSNITTAVQIRDGRTGELLHEGPAGGPWTLGNWFTGPNGLTLAGTASLRTYGPDGKDSRMFTLPQMESGGIATGPGGQKVVLSASASGVDTYDPAQLVADDNYPDPVASLNAGGSREVFAGDLNGDGVDEVVALNFDEHGTDRTAELAGGGYSGPYTAMRRIVTATIDAP
ncbi:hypothetical protein ABZS61_20310 [Streptomyces sp. NPDC005566]|uniref:hypothetical protein n=1 Tax=Streptomyces sp. NPDC005566 TaxID=3156886 RepID=UPI0033BF0304